MTTEEKTHSPIFQWTKKYTNTHRLTQSIEKKKTLTKGNTRIVRKSERLHMCADCRKGRIRANKLNITYNSTRLRENSRNNWYLEQDTILDEYIGAKKRIFFLHFCSFQCWKSYARTDGIRQASFPYTVWQLSLVLCCSFAATFFLDHSPSSLSHRIYAEWSTCEKRDTHFYSSNFIVRKMLIQKMQRQVTINTQTHKRCTLRHMKSAMWLIIIYI